MHFARNQPVHISHDSQFLHQIVLPHASSWPQLVLHSNIGVLDLPAQNECYRVPCPSCLEHILSTNNANALKHHNAKRTNYDVKGIYVHANSQIAQDSTDTHHIIPSSGQTQSLQYSHSHESTPTVCRTYTHNTCRIFRPQRFKSTIWVHNAAEVTSS